MSRFEEFEQALFVDAITVSLPYNFETIKRFLEKNNFDFEPARPSLGYSNAEQIRYKNSNVVGRMMWGGDWCGENVYLQIMGDCAGFAYDLVKNKFPDLYVNRIDVALDFNGSYLFDAFVSIAENISIEKSIKINYVGDWLKRDDGRTLYLGSRKSTYYLRIYEKHKQSKHYDDVINERVRVELEIKPQTLLEKKRVTSMSLIDLISSSRNFKPIYELLLKFTDAVTLTKPRKKTNLENTLAHCSKQYKNLFELLLERSGGCSVLTLKQLISGELL